MSFERKFHSSQATFSPSSLFPNHSLGRKPLGRKPLAPKLQPNGLNYLIQMADARSHNGIIKEN